MVPRQGPRPLPPLPTIEDLTKTYPDGTRAVRGISLRVAPGEAYGFLGPNGAGSAPARLRAEIPQALDI